MLPKEKKIYRLTHSSYPEKVNTCRIQIRECWWVVFASGNLCLVFAHWCQSSTSCFILNVAGFLCTLFMPSFISLHLLEESLPLIFGNKDISSWKLSNAKRSQRNNFCKAVKKPGCGQKDGSFKIQAARCQIQRVGSLAWLNSYLLWNQVFYHGKPLNKSRFKPFVGQRKTRHSDLS